MKWAVGKLNKQQIYDGSLNAISSFTESGVQRTQEHKLRNMKGWQW